MNDRNLKPRTSYRLFFWSPLILCCLLGTTGETRELGPLALLDRCYTHLTGERLKLSSPLRKKVLQGQDPIDLCIDLLQSVKLGSSGEIIDRQSADQRRVLRQMSDLHHSWMTSRTLKSAELLDFNYFQMDLYDPMEASHYISRALFAELPATSILTGNTGVTALRDASTITEATLVGRFLRPSRSIYNNSPGETASAPFIDAAVFTAMDRSSTTPEFEIGTPIIPIGSLTGFASTNKSAVTPVLYTGVFTSQPVAHKQGNGIGLSVPHNIHQHFGGGALGTQSYLTMNLGHGYGFIANGTTKLPRKWIQSALSDFLCLKGPFLRESDVLKDKSAISDAPAFRKMSSCLRCHSTLDPAALVARNLMPTAPTDGFSAILKRVPLTIGSFIASESPAANQEFWPAQSPSNFHRQAAAGLLKFRSSSGKLVQENIQSIEDLGKTLRNSEDFYKCLSKRYLEHFTGIQLSLFDTEDPANSELVNGMKSEERAARNLVDRLASRLQSEQSIRKVIAEIMRLKIYREHDFGQSASTLWGTLK